ncbi:winged helix family transcriptional regulator [Pseudoalteromonas rubra]|nr:winged helix family transcriptional regulator [Pseudoalteromonas rubra]
MNIEKPLFKDGIMVHLHKLAIEDTDELISINGRIYNSSTNQLTTRDNKQVQLKPIQAALLKLFIKHRGKLLSRDEIIQEVWKNKIVEDATVNSTLSRLRNVLGCKGDVIKTHHKIGYCLIGSVEPLEHNIFSERITETALSLDPDSPVTEPPTSKSPSKLFNLSVLTLVSSLILLIIYFLQASILDNTTRPPSNPTLTPLTHTQGIEFFPSLSADKNWLAYTHKADQHSPFELLIQNAKTYETTVIQDAPHMSSPFWAADNQTLYYQTFDNNRCEIKKITPAQIPAQSTISTVTVCGGQLSISPIAISSDNTWLYFSYKASKSMPFIVKRKNLITLEEQQLTFPSQKSYGDYSISLSRDNNKLAFIRSIADSLKELYVLDIEQNITSRIAQYRHVIYTTSWSPNDNEIVFVDSNDNLAAIDVRTRETRVLFSSEHHIQTPISVDTSTLLASVGEFKTNNVQAWSLTQPDEPPTPLIQSSFNDRGAVMFKDTDTTKIAFISNRSGNNQLWLYDGQAYEQLTHFAAGHTLNNLQFSHDGQLISFLDNNQLAILSLAAKEINHFGKLGDNFRNPIWMCGSSRYLLTTRLVNNSWMLHKIDAKLTAVETLLPEVDSVKGDCMTGHYYISKVHEDGIFKLANDFSKVMSGPLLPHTHFLDADEWHLEDGAVFFISQEQLLHTKLSNPGEAKALSSHLQGIKQFSKLGDTILLNHTSVSGSYIAHIQL